MLSSRSMKPENNTLNELSKILYNEFQKQRVIDPKKWGQFLKCLNSNINDINSDYTVLEDGLILLKKTKKFGIFLRINDSMSESINPWIIKHENLLFQENINKILIFWPSTNFINISFIKKTGKGNSKHHYILKFFQGNIPKYFLELIEENNKKSLINLFNVLTNTVKLENVFFDELFKIFDTSKINSFNLIITILTLICTGHYERIVVTREILGEIDISRKISVIDFISRVYENEFYNEDFREIIDILSKNIESKDIQNLLIDISIVKYLLERYSFSIRESCDVHKEIAINPFYLSQVIEKFSSTKVISKKKQGIYFTPSTEAKFISNLVFIRYLCKNYSDYEINEIINAIYNTNHIIKNTDLETPSSPIFIPFLRILDPACGSGIFLISMIKLLGNLILRGLIGNIENLEIYGFDIDPIAYMVTQIRLIFIRILFKKSGIPLKIGLDNLKLENFFLASLPKNFDIILGNPPWVRHEDIKLDSMNINKDQMILKIQEKTKKLSIDKKSDLYIYFCLLSLNLLKTNGVLGFLISNAWLEVKYGRTLQKYLIDPTREISTFEVLNLGGNRIWKNLGINSVLLIIEKGRQEIDKGVKGIFTETRVEFPKIPVNSLKKGIIPKTNFNDKFYRTEVIEVHELLNTNKWAGTFLRATKSEREILKKINQKSEPLSRYASVYFGIKTGANDFFHLHSLKNQKREKNRVYIKNKAGFQGFIEDKYLRPLIKSPTEINGFVLPNDLVPNHYIFYCFDTPSELENTCAYKFILWGENHKIQIKQGTQLGRKVRGFHHLRSVANRRIWYSIGEYCIPNLLWTKSYHIRPGCILNEGNFLPDQRFYSLYIKNQQVFPLIFIFLNSSFVWAQMEISGNTNMGYGVLDTNVYWLKSLKIPFNIIKQDNEYKKILELSSRLRTVKERYSMLESSEIRNSIDQFFSNWFNLKDEQLECLHSFISRTIKKRIGRL